MVGLREVFPPKPTFTEQHLESQAGKVFIITGANSGVGFELAKLLYQKNGTVYIAARSESKIKNAIEAIKQEFPSSNGRLASIVIDLSDLNTIKPAAQDFLGKESRLDVLFHNAGVMLTSNDAKSSQGHELRMATNCLGPQLLTHMLAPLLIETARDQASQKDSVRVVWVSSMINSGSTKGGIAWDEALNKPKILPGGMDQYMQTKVGDVFLAHEWGERLAGDGVVSVSLHPGLMKTELQRDNKAMQTMMGIIFKPAKFGAYTELFAGFSPEVTVQKNGSFLIAWGRFSSVRDDIAAGLKSKEQGGTGLAKTFWDYCESEVNSFKRS
ncbi:short-chain alcohol dehydrogenase [Diaporthe australafricana]|uniref:Short-chain alcohol dehydrogenase n=1 Tax=Diaporthe australafricana TaxID=127596 RepID=A0ABR3W5L6_9PEZI